MLGFLIGYINLSLVRIFRNKIDLYLTHIVKITAVAVGEEDDEHENEFDTDSEQEKRFFSNILNGSFQSHPILFRTTKSKKSQ